MTEPIRINDLISLRDDLPEHNLTQGQIGRVIELFASDEFEVMFADEQRRGTATIQLRLRQMRVLHHEAMLDDAAFWRIIEDAKAESDGNREREYQILVDKLAEMSIADIFEFGDLFQKFYALAYRRELWAAAFLIGNGCGDDSFMDFRGWLIAQGEGVFHDAMRDPETLLDRVEIKCFDGWIYGDAESWAINSVNWDAFEKKTGEEVPILPGVWMPTELTGVDWHEETVPKMYPKLAAKFWSKECDDQA
ncbi:MAG: DUF4240 domain-containing protein [Chloroflexota bacterium]